MEPQTIIDTLVVIGMSVLRIGVPLGLAILFGAWLEKKLHLPDEQDVPRHRHDAKILQFKPRREQEPTPHANNDYETKRANSR